MPLLQALGVGSICAVSLGGLTLLLGPVVNLHGLALWAWIGRIAGFTFCLSLMWCTLSFVRGHRRMVTEPLDLLWERLRMLTPPAPPAEPREPLVIRGYLPRQEAMLIEGELASQAQSIEPQASADIKALYNFVTKVWPTGNVSRDHCTKTLKIRRRDWERFVGGQRGSKAGSESGRGWLDRAGAVDKTCDGWQIVAPLQEVYALNHELEAYANAKAKIVTLARPSSSSSPVQTPNQKRWPGRKE